MGATYKAVEISAPGTFRLVERTPVAPGAGQVRIRVEACSVCHSDAGTVEGQLPSIVYPRVPGHEAIGRIEEIGPEGCPACRSLVLWGRRRNLRDVSPWRHSHCQNPVITGVTSDGGYAEMMIADARALALIPEELKSEDAAIGMRRHYDLQCTPEQWTSRRHRCYPGNRRARSPWCAVRSKDGFSHNCNR
jgi:D-arabinose 1-dehydrogenase-like Zn-dependent alcohol dehydrogenase